MSKSPASDHVRAEIEGEQSLGELQTRLERSRMLRLEAMLDRRSPGIVLIVGLLVLAIVGTLDAASGEFTVEVFYLVPIGLVTFGRGRGLGLMMAGLAAITWGTVEVFQGGTAPSTIATSWNAVSRFFGYAAVALLIAPMRDALVLQRSVAEREAAAAERMRAMEELREAALQPGAEGGSLSVVEPVPGTDAPAVTILPETDPGATLADGEQLLSALSDLERDARRDRRDIPRS